MTLLSRDHFETAYAVLCHFHLIAQRAPVIFSQVSLVLSGTILSGADTNSDSFKMLEPACCTWTVTVYDTLPPLLIWPLLYSPLALLLFPPPFLPRPSVCFSIENELLSSHASPQGVFLSDSTRHNNDTFL